MIWNTTQKARFSQILQQRGIHMKKIFILLLVLTLLFVLCLSSCGAKTPAADSPSPENTQTPIAPESESPSDTPSTSETSESDRETPAADALIVDITSDQSQYTADDGTVLLTASVETPVFSGGMDGVAETIANSFSTLCQSVYDTSAEQLRADAEYYYNSGEYMEPWTPYTADRTVTVTRCDENVLSLCITDYTYSGGVHGYSMVYGYSFNVSDGTVIHLDALSNGTTDTRSFVYGHALEYLQTSAYADGLFDGYEDTLSGRIADGNWYFSDEGLILICNAYDIAPYAAGTILIPISYTDMADILLPTYIPT
jgi:predicted small lipoprotein YifL